MLWQSAGENCFDYEQYCWHNGISISLYTLYLIYLYPALTTIPKLSGKKKKKKIKIAGSMTTRCEQKLNTVSFWGMSADYIHNDILFLKRLIILQYLTSIVQCIGLSFQTLAHYLLNITNNFISCIY